MLAALARSYLYVPGHRPELLAKARATTADAIVIDLEDAVPPQHKQRARDALADTLPSRSAQQIWVRINAVGSGLAEDDLAALATANVSGVRIAKVESPDDVRFVAERLARAGGAPGIHCIIESALGLERISELARAHPSVTGVALGEADLAADLGTSGDDGLLYARSRCVLAARAASLSAPVQSVFTNLADEQALLRSTEAGAALGFFGRSAIHPRQLAVINETYTPTPSRVREARELIEQLEAAVAGGISAFVLSDGRFVDRAVVESARRTVELAERLESRRPGEE